LQRPQQLQQELQQQLHQQQLQQQLHHHQQQQQPQRLDMADEWDALQRKYAGLAESSAGTDGCGMMVQPQYDDGRQQPSAEGLYHYHQYRLTPTQRATPERVEMEAHLPMASPLPLSAAQDYTSAHRYVPCVSPVEWQDSQALLTRNCCVDLHCIVVMHIVTAAVACKATSVQAGLAALVVDTMCHISFMLAAVC